MIWSELTSPVEYSSVINNFQVNVCIPPFSVMTASLPKGCRTCSLTKTPSLRAEARVRQQAATTLADMTRAAGLAVYEAHVREAVLDLIRANLALEPDDSQQPDPGSHVDVAVRSMWAVLPPCS